MLIGQEYTLIGWCNNRLILQDKDMLQGLLRDVCGLISMQPLESIGINVPVQLEKLGKEQFEDEGGSTSCVLGGRADANSASLILSTSHANIHGWPERDSDREDGGFFWFTVGSCRPFEHTAVYDALSRVLHVTEFTEAKRWIYIEDGQFRTSTEGPIQ